MRFIWRTVCYFVLCYLSLVAFCSYDSFAEEPAWGENSYLSMSLENGTTALSMVPGTFSYIQNKVYVETNNISGYNVYVSTADDSTDMLPVNDSDDKISSIESNVFGMTIDEAGRLFSDNLWGMANSSNNGDGWNFYAVPQRGSPGTIFSTYKAENKTETITYGIKVGENLEFGTYKNTLEYTVVANLSSGVMIGDAEFFDSGAEIISWSGATITTDVALSPSDTNDTKRLSVTMYNTTDDVQRFTGSSFVENTNSCIEYSLANINVGDVFAPGERGIDFEIIYKYTEACKTMAHDNSTHSTIEFAFEAYTVNTFSVTATGLDFTPTPDQLVAYDDRPYTLNLHSSQYLIHIYMDGSITEDYSFENGILTIPNVTGDITIEAHNIENIDIVIDEHFTSFSAKGVTPETPIPNLQELLQYTFDGANYSDKVIDEIDVYITYSSSTGASQSTAIELTHNGSTTSKTITYQGKQTNRTVTVSFTNLNIRDTDTFSFRNTASDIKNGNVQVSEFRIEIKFKDAGY